MESATSAPTVHLLCGLNGAGKTTYARKLAAERQAVHFILDAWMLQLHPELRFDAPEYGALAERCKHLIWSVALQVLALGHEVILDWNQWSRVRRATWRDLAQQAGYQPLLHYLQVPVAVAIAQSNARNAAAVADAHRLDEAGIRHFVTIFEEPTADEGLAINVIRPHQ